jgi:hypothetical protein
MVPTATPPALITARYAATIIGLLGARNRTRFPGTIPSSRLIIDPISSYLGKVDSHKNAEVRSVLEPLGELAARRGVAIICNNHFSKGGGNAPKTLKRARKKLGVVAEKSGLKDGWTRRLPEGGQKSPKRATSETWPPSAQVGPRRGNGSAAAAQDAGDTPAPLDRHTTKGNGSLRRCHAAWPLPGVSHRSRRKERRRQTASMRDRRWIPSSRLLLGHEQRRDTLPSRPPS